MRMRRTATKHYEIQSFNEIGYEGGYRTPTGFRFMVRTAGNELRLYVDNRTVNMIVDTEGRNARMEVDEMDRPYFTFDSEDIANELKTLFHIIGTIHGLEGQAIA